MKGENYHFKFPEKFRKKKKSHQSSGLKIDTSFNKQLSCHLNSNLLSIF